MAPRIREEAARQGDGWYGTSQNLGRRRRATLQQWPRRRLQQQPTAPPVLRRRRQRDSDKVTKERSTVLEHNGATS
ncbi:unnamed protein product [Urochloa humidicola]